MSSPTDLTGDEAEGGEGSPPDEASEITIDVPEPRSDDETESLGTRRRTPGSARAARLTEFVPGSMVAGRYRIVHLLGRGGMGEVYRADDLTLDQPVALKFLRAGLENDEERLKLLFHEVKIARKITHPNVCRVYDLGEADGVYFLSMEYIDGEDVASLLRQIGRLPWDKALETARQVAGGLAAAHEAGILHRDLKPANLMIDGRGQARIADFGLAALSDRIGGAAARSGTPGYMAPEQLTGREVTAQSDIYALGLVLYELFAGRKAFAVSGDESKNLETRRPQPPSAFRPGFDPEIERLLLQCLEPEPARRPASAADVVEALTHAEEPEEEGAQLRTLVISRLLHAHRWVESLGDVASADLLAVHDRMVRDLLKEHGGREIDKTDAFLLLFQRPWEAVRWALAYHRALADLGESRAQQLGAQVGVHLGEVVLRRNAPADVARGAKPLEVEGLARPTTIRIAALALEGQTLLTRAAFDVARRGAVGEAESTEDLRWLAHGTYAFRGIEEPTEVFEVGVDGAAPLREPAESEEARRVAGEDTILGWRPAPGLGIPQRRSWKVVKKVGEGGFGEVWLGEHRKTHEKRIYKFCYEAERLRSLHREVTVFRLLKEELGDRDDIARLLDWNLEEAPYFIEFAYSEAGSLIDCSESRGGITEVPLEERLEIAAQVATALEAAHSVGVLHKDVKPSNVLIDETPEGGSQAALTDFGIGLITENERLAAKGITVIGGADGAAADEDDDTSGTPLYIAPELLAGRSPTIQSDIYALGVMLYQMVAGDLERPLAPGWERHVDDDLLREDIARMVDGNPSRRPRSAGEVADALKALEGRRAEREERLRITREAERAHRRRRVLTIAASVSTAFLIVVSLLAWDAFQARSDALRRRDQAEQLIDFMLNDLYDGLERIGRLDLLEQVARGSQVYFDSLTERDESPDALHQRGVTLLYIGDVLLDGGDTEAALAAYESSVDLFEDGVAGDPSDLWLSGLCRGRIRVGKVLSQRGDTDAALETLAAASEMAEGLARGSPGDRQRQYDLARAYYETADVQRQVGDRDAAIETVETAVELATQLVGGAERSDWRHWSLLVDGRIELGDLLRYRGDYGNALASFEQARIEAEALLERDPSNAAWPRRLALMYYSIGLLHYLEDNWKPALDSLEAAQSAYAELSREDPARVELRVQRAQSLSRLALVHSAAGSPEKAIEPYGEALGILENLVAEDPTHLRRLERLATLRQSMAWTYLQMNRTSAALESAGLAHDLLEQLVDATGDDTDPLGEISWNHILIGDIHAARGESDEARRRWTLALEVIEPITARSDELWYLDSQARALLKLGRLEDAKPLVERLLERGWKDSFFLEAVRNSGLAVEAPVE